MIYYFSAYLQNKFNQNHINYLNPFEFKLNFLNLKSILKLIMLHNIKYYFNQYLISKIFMIYKLDSINISILIFKIFNFLMKKHKYNSLMFFFTNIEEINIYIPIFFKGF